MALQRSLCVFGRQGVSNAQVFRLPFLHARYVVMKASPASDPKVLNHDDKNEKLGRPMSPHLTIYRPQLTSMMSLSHRASGIILSGYAIILAGVSFVGDLGIIAATIQGWHLPFLLTFPLKFGLSYPASYHFCNGIRHLIWDAGKALELKEVYITGYGCIAIAVLLALYMATR